MKVHIIGEYAPIEFAMLFITLKTLIKAVKKNPHIAPKVAPVNGFIPEAYPTMPPNASPPNDIPKTVMMELEDKSSCQPVACKAEAPLKTDADIL